MSGLHAVSTKSLLVSGIAGAVLSPLAVLIQAFTREGFNLAVHPISLLSLGEFGWIQIVNFIVSGLLFIGFGVGLRRTLRSGRGGLWGPLLIGIYGFVLIAAGVFAVDPMLGFPPGAPEGLPQTLSWHAQLHNFTFILAFLGLIVSQFVFARRFASAGRRGFATYCVATGLATLVLIALSQGAPTVSGYILYGTGVMTDVWVVLLAMRGLAEHQAPPRSKEAITR